MVRVASIGAAVAVLAASGPTAVRAEEPSKGLQIGVVSGLFRDVPPGMIKVLGSPLQKLISSKTGVTGDLEMVPDALALADKLKDNKCHIGVFHGYEFAWAKARNPNLVPLAVTVYPGGKPQACVVVHKDNAAAGFADLKDAAVTVPTRTKGHCWAYLDRQRAGMPATAAAPKTKPAVTAEEALDAVVSGESQAVLVDASALIGYEKLQPGATKHIRVLCQSERFPQNVIAYNKGGLTEDTAAGLRTVLTEAHKTTGGKPLMMLWSIQGFGEVPADYDEHLAKTAKEYPAPKPAAPAPSGGE